MVGSLLTQNKSIGDTQNENHHLLSPSEMHPPQVVERNGLLLACAASASRIWPWPVCRSSFSGEPLAQRDNNFPFPVARFHVLLRLIGSAPGRRTRGLSSA